MNTQTKRSLLVTAGMFLAVLLLSAMCGNANAFTPRSGAWWNPAESGTGYTIDIQDGTLVLYFYSYKTNGDSEWYISSGGMSERDYTGTLLAVRGGQSLSGAYQAPSQTIPSGTVSIHFDTAMSGTMTLPGRTFRIVPFDFGGGFPHALLGEWVFVEQIGTYFADHYVFTTQSGKTSNGDGIVVDAVNNALCEHNVTGTYAGKVFCAHFDSLSAGASVLDIYVWTFGIDRTYDGVWISPNTGNAYTMRGSRYAFSNGRSIASVTTPGTSSQIARKTESTTPRTVQMNVGDMSEQAASMLSTHLHWSTM